MGALGLVWGIFAMLSMLVALIPLLGWLNWLVIPFSIIGIIISAIGMSGRQRSGSATGGLVLCLIASVFGGIRLMLGGGLL